MSTATELRAAGVETRVVDMRAYVSLGRRRFLEIFQACLSRTAGFVGMCVTTPQIDFALQLSHIVKQSTDLPVVWSGAHPTLYSEQTAAHPLVDVCISGCEEEGYLRLLGGEAGRIIRTDAGQGPGGPLDITTLVDLAAFAQVYYDPERRARPGWTLFTGRGGCIGASLEPPPGFGRGRRSKSIETILAAVTRLRDDFGAEYICFLDAMPFSDKEGMATLGDALQRMGLCWSAAATPAQICADPKYFARMRSLGWASTDVDCVSGSDAVLSKLGVRWTQENIYRAAEVLGRAGVFARYSAYIDLPGEAEADRVATLGLAQELSKGYARVIPPRRYAPVPGTRLFGRLLRTGWEAPEELDDWCELFRPRGFAPSPEAAAVGTAQNTGRAVLLAKAVERLPRSCSAVLTSGGLSAEALSALKRRCRRLVVLEPDAEAARALSIEVPGIEWVTESPVAMTSMPDGDFDCVWMPDLVKMGAGAFAALQEARRVLRPGGKLVLGVDAKAAGDDIAWAHPEELAAMLAHAGLDNALVEEINPTIRTETRDGEETLGITDTGGGDESAGPDEPLDLVAQAYSRSAPRGSDIANAYLGW